MNAIPDQDTVLSAIRTAATTLGRPPSRSEFKAMSGMTEYQVLRYFPGWREAVRAAGLSPYSANAPVPSEAILEDCGELVRRLRRIPTRETYRKEGNHSPSLVEKKLGPWSGIPAKFRAWTDGKSEWTDVVALLPLVMARTIETRADGVPLGGQISTHVTTHRHVRLSNRPTYGIQSISADFATSR